MSEEEDFVFCDVRWRTPGGPTEHVCAEHRPRHEEHVCCCEAVAPTRPPLARGV